MPDMLVKLYDLPESDKLGKMAELGVNIRPAMTSEKKLICQWICEHFNESWAGEAEAALTRQPVSLFVATIGGKFIGFACYDSTARGFFGPTGVDEKQRGNGVGEALLFKSLQNMRDIGYGYAIIGWAGPVGFYADKVNATVIEGSEPGVYADLITE